MRTGNEPGTFRAVGEGALKQWNWEGALVRILKVFILGVFTLASASAFGSSDSDILKYDIECPAREPGEPPATMGAVVETLGEEVEAMLTETASVTVFEKKETQRRVLRSAWDESVEFLKRVSECLISRGDLEREAMDRMQESSREASRYIGRKAGASRCFIRIKQGKAFRVQGIAFRVEGAGIVFYYFNVIVRRASLLE